MGSFARRALKISARAVDRVHGPARGGVVLIYHRVGGRSGLEVDLPAPAFETQMSLLARSGRVVSLDDALDALEAPVPPSRDPVVVTFDDGTGDATDVGWWREQLAYFCIAFEGVDKGLRAASNIAKPPHLRSGRRKQNKGRESGHVIGAE